MILNVNNFALIGNVRTGQYPSLNCNSDIFIVIKFSSNVTITDLSIRNCGSTINAASLTIINCINCNILNVTCYTPTGYCLVGINLIGHSYLDNMVINLKASPNGICGKGISLVHNDKTSISTNSLDLVNTTIVISNFIVSGKLSRCLSYGRYVDEQGDFLSIKLNQTKYGVAIKICHSLFYEITYYKQPVLYAFINCNINYLLFENCTFSEIQLGKDALNQTLLPSMISIYALFVPNC